MRSVRLVQATSAFKARQDTLTHYLTSLMPSFVPVLLRLSFISYCMNPLLSFPPEHTSQGTIPFAPFWVSTRPFGTPLGPYATKWTITILIILALPAGDAFNFVVDLGVYPSSFFHFLLAIGLYFVRYRRKKLGLPRQASGFKAWEVALLFTIAANFYLLVMPWYPPASGATGGDVSFWYATYVVAGIGM